MTLLNLNAVPTHIRRAVEQGHVVWSFAAGGMTRYNRFGTMVMAIPIEKELEYVQTNPEDYKSSRP